MATSDWLLLQLDAGTEGPPVWALADAGGALQPLPAEDADGTSLAVHAIGRQVALLVPAGEVSLFQVPLPAGNEARLQQLAPFALEEQVSEDLEDLHFAVGARDAGSGQVPVAVVSRERMAQWISRASALGLRPTAMFARGDLAPLVPGHVTLLLDEDQLILRNDSARPVCFPADDPQLALGALLGAQTPLSVVNLIIHATPECWQQHETALQALRDRVASFKVQLHTAGLLGLYAEGIAGSAPVNLLQGAFRPQSTAGGTWKRWRTAAGLLLGLLLLHAAGSLWELRQLRQSSAALDESIERAYGAIFPGQQPGPAPRRALEARLDAVAGAGSPRGELMPLLAALAAARQNVPVATLETMTYKPGALQLQLSAPDATTLEQFSQALRAGGYNAQITSGSQREGGFQGQIDLTAAGS